MSRFAVATSTLPESIRSALVALSYHRAHIDIEIADTARLASGSGDGYRAFVCVVNLATGERETLLGSWGGANPFQVNRVDSDDRAVPLGPNVAVIKGQQGGTGPVLAHLILSSRNVIPTLPAPSSVTPREAAILYVFCSIKSSYRKEYFARAGVTPAEIESLIARNLLKSDKRGTAITVDGRNAAANDERGLESR